MVGLRIIMFCTVRANQPRLAGSRQACSFDASSLPDRVKDDLASEPAPASIPRTEFVIWVREVDLIISGQMPHGPRWREWQRAESRHPEPTIQKRRRAGYSIGFLSPPHGWRWIDHGFKICLQACLQLLGFVSLHHGTIMFFGDILNNIEELCRLDFALGIHLCQ